MLNFLKSVKLKAPSQVIAQNKTAMSATQFNNAMSFARDTIEYTKSDGEKLIILTFLMEAMRTDLQAECLSAIFYEVLRLCSEVQTQ